MVRVPSPTSKYGFHEFTMYTVSRWRPIGYPWQGPYTNPVVYAYSNRPPPKRGSPPLATSYYRKLAYLTSLSDVSVVTSSHEFESSHGIGERGVTLAGVPYGSAYGDGNVGVPGWMTDQCIQQCMLELTDVRANILEDLGSARQTVSMMADILRTIVELFLMARKGQWKRLRRRLRPSLKGASNGWLMYFYGIKPLVSTMMALSESYAAKRKLKTVTRSVSIPVDPMGFIATGAARKPQAIGKAEQGCKVGMTVAIDLTADMSMRNALGLNLDLTDLVITAWALTPYSFIVDWVLPVERFLATRSWRSGLAYQSGYVDKRLWCDATYTVYDPMYGANDRGKLPRARLQALQFQRIAYNTFSPPSGLSFKQSLSPTQTISAIALMLQRM